MAIVNIIMHYYYYYCYRRYCYVYLGPRVHVCRCVRDRDERARELAEEENKQKKKRTLTQQYNATVYFPRSNFPRGEHNCSQYALALYFDKVFIFAVRLYDCRIRFWNQFSHIFTHRGPKKYSMWGKHFSHTRGSRELEKNIREGVVTLSNGARGRCAGRKDAFTYIYIYVHSEKFTDFALYHANACAVFPRFGSINTHNVFNKRTLSLEIRQKKKRWLLEFVACFLPFVITKFRARLKLWYIRSPDEGGFLTRHKTR